MIPAYPLGVDRAKLAERGRHLLESLDIGDKAQSMAEWLSGGEAQRVAIARALINDPEVVIADEPTANLDSERSRQFLGIVETLKAAGKTVLMTSHDPLVCDTAVVDHVVSLRDGQLVETS